MREFRMIMRIGTKTRFAHFQSYENSPVFSMNSPIFGMNSPVFSMNVQTSDEPLKLLFPLLHAFHPSEKSFKTQLI
ncbi:hypothetical protein PVL29_017124 [Vitis rotundifolia]|uniref:Uncharacterized protein n=1 Tax=Vitis rotundifolia TaxID=103349 RepID=A0AA38ZAF0_VITRO|nr:hypothetical protein PVL29_017124 [Vitis rotundifolia]